MVPSVVCIYTHTHIHDTYTRTFIRRLYECTHTHSFVEHMEIDAMHLEIDAMNLEIDAMNLHTHVHSLNVCV